jgi:TRAP-type C4-dicarboxylate transport system permease small subunit
MIELPFMSAVSGIITNPTAQKLLNLGIPAKYIKAAGPAGLTAMGITSLVDLARKSQKEFDQCLLKNKRIFKEQEEFAESVNREQFGSDD